MRKLLFLLTIYTFSVMAADSQRQSMRFNHLNDYTHGTPRAITRDSYGFLWIGTNDGLLKYDGYQYTKFTPDDSINSISGRVVRDILYDTDGNLWIGTTNGLDRYDYIKNTFTHINLGEGSYIYDIYESTNGDIWVATRSGLFLINGDQVNDLYNTVIKKNGLSVDLGRVRKILQDIDENIWIGTQYHGLAKYHPLENKIIEHTHDQDIEWVMGVSEFNQDELLVSTYTNGIYIVNKNNNLSRKLDLGIDDLRIRDNIRVSDKSHWISTLDDGIFVLENDSFSRIDANDEDDRTIRSKRIRTIYEDSENNIWVATTNNISVAKLNHKTYENFFVDGTKSGLSEKDIYAIHGDTNGNLYFGSYETTVIDKRNFDGTITKIPLVKDHDDSVISTNVNQILYRDGTLWIATSNGLLKSKDEMSFEVIDATKTSDDAIISIATHRAKPVLLLGTNNGLLRFDYESNQIQPVAEIEKNPVNYITYDGKTHWVVTSGAVYNLNESLKTLQTITSEQLGLETPSSESDLSGVAFLGSDTIAVSSLEKGVSIYDLKNKRITARYAESNGLSSNIVYSLVVDNQGNLWASTQQGISRIVLNSGRVDVLNIEDGLQSEEYHIKSVFKSISGKLYFGGTEGVTSFHPQRVIKEERVPKLLWSRFETVKDGNTVPGIPSDSTLVGDLDTDITFELPYSKQFNAEFSSSILLKSDWIKFQTRLNSSGNEDWIRISNDDRKLKISLLPPGSHTFEVRASLNGRDWSEPLSMQIYKAPPPWQTWWAYFGYLLIISSVIGYFLRIQYQKAQEKMRSQKLIRDSEERLKLALWGSRDELWDWNLISGKIHRSNTWGLLSFPKRDTDEHGSNALFRNIHPKDLPSVRAALDDHKNGYTSHYEATYRVKDKEGQWIWILDRGKIVEHDSEGKPLRMSGTIRNISDIRDTQEQLDLIAKAFENTSDGVFILDNHFKYQAVNKAYEKITGFKFSDKKDKLFDIHSTHTSAKDVLHKVRQSLVLDGAWQGELEDTRASGELYTIELKLDAVRDRLDEITHFVGVFSDITYRKKAEQDLRRMANYDQLTGLPNRSLFQDRLKHAIALSDRNSKELILLFIDLDNFKIVNDSLGHSIGDRLLTKVAERISACVRSNDTVARLGGDEYTILLEQVEGSLVGTRVADKILDALSRPFRIQGHELVIGCSIGIAMYPDDGADVETLLRNADTAMYSAKYQTKNTYQFFTDSMNKKANSRLEMEHELRKAIPAGDIKVVYQPKVDLTTGRIVGCEALARWQHPELGFVSPEDFISLAEETGLIYSLGESVLNNACAATAEWKKHHGYGGRTAVNLSAIQFRQTGLLDSIESIVNKHGLSGSDIELELTEGMLVTNPDSVNQIMSDFRAKDYHLSIDDFGTGYASMAQLKNFPINTLKIDKTFIDDLTNNEQDASLVKAVLSLAQNLNLSTVAEGVEYQEQVEALSAMGCESIQGYVYSKPISADLFAALLESNLTLNEVIKRNNEKIINFPA